MGVIFQSGEVDGILKAIQDARTIIEQQVSDMRILAQAMLEVHALSCENCPEEAVRACSGQDVDLNANCCKCHACTIAREVLK